MQRLLWSNKGQVLIETMIALIFVGSLTYIIVNTDIIPGLKLKWDAINSAIQGKWIR